MIPLPIYSEQELEANRLRAIDNFRRERLQDQRDLALECKVSNSATNSVRRLNNDAAAKAAGWLDDYGSKQVMPAAVLAGVFKLHNLVDAQSRGLTLFWEHDLAKLIGWINAMRITPLQRSALDANSDQQHPIGTETT